MPVSNTIPTQSVFYQKMPEDSRLTVNEDSRHHQVFEKSEAEGIEELRRNSKTFKKEESWIYVRGQEPHTGKTVELWYEVGEFESNKSAYTDYKHLAAIQKDLKTRGVQAQAWSNYHFHPEQVEVDGNNERDPNFKGVEYSARVLSATDYIASAQFEIHRQKHFSDMPPIDLKVVTPDGVWSSRLNRPVGADEKSLYRKLDLRWNIDRPAKKYDRYVGKGIDSCASEKGYDAPDYRKIQDMLTTRYMDVDYQSFEADNSRDLDTSVQMNRLNSRFNNI